jgi:predicted RNA-binding Zn-ribbon protein involved in translation (DUF1610 family)
MRENTVVRENLMTEKGYTPYCGSNISRDVRGGCDNPRTHYNKKINQFVCPKCGFTSQFPPDFIKRYKEKWNIV